MPARRRPARRRRPCNDTPRDDVKLRYRARESCSAERRQRSSKQPVFDARLMIKRAGPGPGDRPPFPEHPVSSVITVLPGTRLAGRASVRRRAGFDAAARSGRRARVRPGVRARSRASGARVASFAPPPPRASFGGGIVPAPSFARRAWASVGASLPAPPPPRPPPPPPLRRPPPPAPGRPPRSSRGSRSARTAASPRASRAAGRSKSRWASFDTLEEALDAYNAEARRRGVPTQTLPPAEDAPEEQSSNLSRDARPTASAASDASARTSERIVREVLDSSFPGRWYPAARSMRRSIHLHVGPTNSGKTHAAIRAPAPGRERRVLFAASPPRVGGARIRSPRAEVLLGPAGAACDLVTGQGRRREGARHVACTVEMADVTRPVAVAVIDEAHLLGDARRGYAFTRATRFARRGGASVEEATPRWSLWCGPCARELGDDLEVCSYERLQKLHLLEEPLRRIEDVGARGLPGGVFSEAGAQAESGRWSAGRVARRA